MSAPVTAPITLVAIDDDHRNLELVSEVLARDGLEILPFTDALRGLEVVQRKRAPIVLVDLKMPQLSGIELLERVLQTDPAVEVILMTGHYSTDSAVEAIQKGAADYLTKPLDFDRLSARIESLLRAIRHRQRAARLDQELLETCQFEGIVGRSPLMLEVFARIQRVAPHFRTVLVTGATGTGKELVARALYGLSPAAKGQFAVCNCSAIVESLFESELFGHVKGSFTGATQDRAGLFEYAHRGVVLLDEIGEMPLATQAKLLRVLQNQEIQRVGSPAVHKVDVRVVAATNRDLRAMAAAKQFREDLYFRLSMVEIKLPRLRERLDDLPLLQRFFLERFAAQYVKPVRGLTRRAQALLARYSWPGNVRELENVLGHACLMAPADVLDISDLPPSLVRGEPAGLAADEGLLSLQEVERRHVLRVLQRVQGNKARAAEILGIGRTTLYRQLAEMDLPAENDDSQSDTLACSR